MEYVLKVRGGINSDNVECVTFNPLDETLSEYDTTNCNKEDIVAQVKASVHLYQNIIEEMVSWLDGEKDSIVTIEDFYNGIE
jgi:hypothetical protein